MPSTSSHPRHRKLQPRQCSIPGRSGATHLPSWHLGQGSRWVLSGLPWGWPGAKFWQRTIRPCWGTSMPLIELLVEPHGSLAKRRGSTCRQGHQRWSSSEPPPKRPRQTQRTGGGSGLGLSNRACPIACCSVSVGYAPAQSIRDRFTHNCTSACVSCRDATN